MSQTIFSPEKASEIWINYWVGGLRRQSADESQDLDALPYYTTLFPNNPSLLYHKYGYSKYSSGGKNF
jgi:hypothetical protein